MQEPVARQPGDGVTGHSGTTASKDLARSRRQRTLHSRGCLAPVPTAVPEAPGDLDRAGARTVSRRRHDGHGVRSDDE
jgi:hypothetical protein